jgi:ATP-dependent DNA helicase DinG
MSQVEEIFAHDGVLARTVDHYEERSSQREMARAIEEAIERERLLLVEAGTGVGKSLAYLVPFILWARENGKKVLVSTYTKTLQLQLVEKDLPFLKEVLDTGLRYALCVGSQNYLCLRRLSKVRVHDLYESPGEGRQIKRIVRWESKTKSGLKSDLDFEPLTSLWSRICRESDLCFGQKCPYFGPCYYMHARRVQRDAHILVINHHLFFANLVSGENVLPPYDAVVFDEAHSIEEVAVNYLGIEVTNYRIKYLVDTLYNPKTKKGLLPGLGEGLKIAEARQQVQNLRTASDGFFQEVAKKLVKEKVPYRIRKAQWMENTLEDPLRRLEIALLQLRDRVSEEDSLELSAFLSRVKEIREQLDSVLDMEEEEHVYWVNLEKRQVTPRISLNASALNIAQMLEALVFNRIAPLVLTSATLSTDGTFDYIKGRLGVGSAEVSILDSPFDYGHNALLYVAGDLPDPKDVGSFQKKSLERMLKLLAVTRGRTFVLFTSFRFLEEAYEAFSSELSGFSLMKQGEKPQYQMIEDFKRMENAVLLGTNTFWQGVDVPGRALESVIITKLPFAVPDEPVTEARMELMQIQNINPFVNYQVPQAIIWLKQGFGRLIRSNNDRGMVAILDPRVVTKSYGKRFVDSLPRCRIACDLRDVERFFQELEAARG